MAKLTPKQCSRLVKDGDRYASLLCIHAAGHRCEKCGSTYNLEHHHPVAKGMGRGLHWSYRLHDLNRVCLCKGCHDWAGSQIMEFLWWLREHDPARDRFTIQCHELIYNQPDPTVRRDELKAEWARIDDGGN